MLIAVIGESCTGKSTLAKVLGERLGAEVYTGKDYLRLAKNEAIARKLFEKKLAQAENGENIIYVISEEEHLSLLPGGAVRVLMTADLELIEHRFAERMRGILPPPVKQMLQRKHGCFDAITRNFHIHNGDGTNAVLLQLTAGRDGNAE